MSENAQHPPQNAQRNNTRTATAGPRTGAITRMPTVPQPFANIVQQTDSPAARSCIHQPVGRTLILAFDGTSNLYDETNTNVVMLFDLLEKDSPDRQLLYYQPGIGTYAANPGLWSPPLIKLAKIADLALAVYLDAHICSGYRFLVDNYRVGDKICLFGFSRGAYTARCLAGMLNKVGLLTQGNHEQVPFAYKLYMDETERGIKRASGFKKVFSRPVTIEFLGVWDTVSSVGLLYGRHLPFTDSNDVVRKFRHALALDERRAKFKANVWRRCKKDEDKKEKGPKGLQHGSGILSEAPQQTEQRPDEKSMEPITEKEEVDEPSELPTLGHKPTGVKGKGTGEKDGIKGANPPRLSSSGSLKRIFSGRSRVQRKDTDYHIEEQGDYPNGFSPTHVHDSDEIHDTTDVLEVWFAGCHADVGGGAVPDVTPNTLGGPSLRWMIRELIDARAGVLFDEAALVKMDIDPTPHAPRGLLGYEDVLARLATSSTDEKGGESNESVNSAPDSHEDHHKKRLTLRSLTDLRVDEKHRRIKREMADAGSQMFDQLKEAPAWRILEYLPIQWHFEDEHGKPQKRYKPNLKKPRTIGKLQGVNLHVSVKMRMENLDHKYKPRARYAEHLVNWVE